MPWQPSAYPQRGVYCIGAHARPLVDSEPRDHYL